MKYLFGPVNSRRFGLSLGIDLSPDKKSCNFDCLYCELDKAKPVSMIQNEPDPEEIISEIKHFLQKNPYPEVITITANGEPTLYSKLDILIKKLQKIKGNSKLLILSNGSTIHKKEIQETLKNLDIVKISLDAADQKTFKKVNKTLKDINIKNIIQGLKEFRKIFKGFLIIEILVVKNINDFPENIKNIAEVLKDIQPDRVDLGTIDRPPAYRVFPVSDEELLKLGEYLKDFNLNIITRGKDNILSEFELSEEEILNTFRRRPYTYSDIEKVFNQETVNKIKDMIANGKLIEKKVGDTSFILPG